MRTQTQNVLPGQRPLLGPGAGAAPARPGGSGHSAGAGLGSLCPSAEQELLPGTLLQLSRAS